MSNISAEEWQVLSFFEVEPKLRDADVPWCYNDALYRVQQGDFAFSFAVDPSYRDVRLILSHQGNRLYEFNALGVKDVRYSSEDKTEALEIKINDFETLTIRLKPRIELCHSVAETA